jgi:cyclophilin family peptidyl-prolyl cis-trans isomerase
MRRPDHAVGSLAVFSAAFLVMLAGCTKQPEKPKEAAKEAAPAPPAAPEAKPEEKKAEAPSDNVYKVKFATTKGDFIVEVHRDWAPLGAQRFYELVKDGYYDNSGFFRVVPNFVIQFGLAADPAKTKKWDKPIKDDPVVRTNGLGTVTFATAGPNTRTTQVFINLRSNQRLDDQGFAPFGKVIEGMNVVERIYAGYGEQPDQDLITRMGNKYLKEKFPNLDYIKKASIL